MHKKLPAILTLLGALFAVGVVLATDLVDPAAEGVSAPYLIAGSRVTPSYPPAAYAAKFAGVVKLRATVNADGSVGAIEVLDSSRTNMGFEQAALDAVTQWQFEPARRGDSTVDSFTEIHPRCNPPSRNARGLGASASGAASASGPSAGAITASPALPMRTPSTDDAAKNLDTGISTAWLPIEYVPYRKYGRPPSQIGAIYDRRELIPPGTGGGGLSPR